jgi:hypothetical protein
MNPVPPAKLQHVYFKHAVDFGVTGPWSAANGALFEQALQDHINDPATVQIQGTYRGALNVTHYYDLVTHRNVMVDAADELVSGWRLSVQQVSHLLVSGNVQ